MATKLTKPITNDDTGQHIAVHPWKYRFVVNVVAGLLAISSLSVFFFPRLLGGVWIGDTFLPYSFSVLIFTVAYTIASVKQIQTDQYGGITVFNQPSINAGPSWWFVPLVVTKLRHRERSVQEMIFPGPPEKVSKKPDDEPLLPGEVRPIRIQTGRPDPNLGDDPLNSQMTLEVQWYVRWQVEQENYFDFDIRLPGRDWEEEKTLLYGQMRDVGTAAIAADFAKGPVSVVIDGLENLNKKMKPLLQKAFSGSGILIVQAGVESPDLRLTVNQALADLAASKAGAQTTRIKAAAERNRLTEEGLGRAAAREAEITAEGKGVAAAAEAIGISGQEYLSADVAMKTIGKGTIIIGTDGVREAIGVGKAILNMLPHRPANEEE
ncbi:MAG: SPFH domain-containing protein [Candidatus Pacebacteria bacterium]|nr:SPFH domain-containing protein [Candidatus Paceibacterota bacterium]